MAKDEAKVRVRLDTAPARADLRQLNKDAQKSGGRISGGIRRAIGKGMGAVGLGAGIGLGIAAVRGATQSGISDVVGESFSAIGAQINEFFLGDLDDKARATRRGREDMIAAFGYQSAEGVAPGAHQFFQNRVAEYAKEEQGRSIIEQDPRFAGPQIDDILKRITTAIGELLSTAVADLANKLTFGMLGR